jgi:hypothetical protein
VTSPCLQSLVCNIYPARDTPQPRYTKDEVTSFMKSMVTWMEQKDWVLAYSWHDSGVGSSALLDSSGQLTALGAIYASL